LNNLARAAELINNSEAFDCLDKVLALEQKRFSERAFYLEKVIAKSDGSAQIRLRGLF
jgi:hypothetical protein